MNTSEVIETTNVISQNIVEILALISVIMTAVSGILFRLGFLKKKQTKTLENMVEDLNKKVAVGDEVLNEVLEVVKEHAAPNETFVETAKKLLKKKAVEKLHSIIETKDGSNGEANNSNKA